MLRSCRAFLLLVFLSGVVLADVACVRKVRTVNDNFYVMNRKTAATKPSAAPSSIPAVATPQLSDAATEVLKVQANSGPRVKSSLSNVGILEEENSQISSLLRAAQTEPENASVHYELGRAYHDYRVYDEALRHYQDALKLEPENPRYYEQIGKLWRDWGSLELGVNLVRKSLELDPGFADAWNTLGSLLDRQGNPELAQDAYLHALSLNQDLDYVQNNVCFSYLQSGHVEQAIHHCLRAIDLNPNLVVAHNNLGIAYGMQGRFDRSLEEFKQSGDEAAALNNLGLMLLQHGHFEASMGQFKLAARLRPYYKEAAANYRRARDLSSQRAREARARARLFDRGTQTEHNPEMLGLVAIENLGLMRLGGALDLLFAPSLAPCPSSPPVDGDIETIESRAFDEKEVRELLAAECIQLRRLRMVPSRRRDAVAFYKQGYINEALAHRIPGHQVVLRTSALDQDLLGLDLAQMAKQPSESELCTTIALSRSTRGMARNAR